MPQPRYTPRLEVGDRVELERCQLLPAWARILRIVGNYAAVRLDGSALLDVVTTFRLSYSPTPEEIAIRAEKFRGRIGREGFREHAPRHKGPSPAKRRRKLRGKGVKRR